MVVVVMQAIICPAAHPQLQELHRLLEAAAAKAGRAGEERDEARAEAARLQADLQRCANVARVNLRAQVIIIAIISSSSSSSYHHHVIIVVVITIWWW